MPELPDLEVIAEFLQRHVAGARIEEARILKPIVVRDLTGRGFATALAGQSTVSIARRAKFLLFELSSSDWLVIKPMLAGRLRYRASGERVGGKPFAVLRFADGRSLSYYDPQTMGKLYLTPALELVPTFSSQGPEALAPELTPEAFSERLNRHRGEIKGVLTNQSFVAGIGSAYSDEILFHAGVYPFRKRPSLTSEEVRRLYEAMHGVLESAIATLRQRMGSNIHVEIRDFLQVHGRGGEPCPRCGNAISKVRVRRRLTNFCRACQPGLLVGN